MSTPLKFGVTLVTPHARNMVRAVFQARPEATAGLSTQEIYRTAHEIFPDAKTPWTGKKTARLGLQPAFSVRPPHEGHPLYSMRHLKKHVLEEMEASGEIEKVVVRRDTWDSPVSVKSRGKTLAVLPPTYQTAKKTCWLWRMCPKEDNDSLQETHPSSQTANQPSEPNFESEDFTAFLADPTGWEGRLKFKNVPDIGQRIDRGSINRHRREWDQEDG